MQQARTEQEPQDDVSLFQRRVVRASLDNRPVDEQHFRPFRVLERGLGQVG